MDALLKASYHSDELELAAAIGATSEPIDVKIEKLFTELVDPLLSANNVTEILGLPPASINDVGASLDKMVAEDYLEFSTSTDRPLDDDGTKLYRVRGITVSRLKLLASESKLSNGTSRFQFTCDGRLLRSIARIDRLDALSDKGQQREEIKKHVEGIKAGIESGIQVPNSVLLVFQESTTSVEPSLEDELPNSFVIVRPLQGWQTVASPVKSESIIQTTRLVEIDIPFRPAAFDDEKPALLVDGQQRTAGLLLSNIDKVDSFAFSVNAVITNEEEAKKVFQIANSTVKISTQFSRALVASMSTTPGYLKPEQKIAKAVRILALEDKSSPFYHLVQYPGLRQTPRPPVAYNSLFQVVATFNESALKFADEKQLATAVIKAFSIAKKNWPGAWGLKPDKSKLMHGIGLRAFSSVAVEKIEGTLPHVDASGDPLHPLVWASVENSLERLSDHVAWTVEDAENSKTAGKLYRDEILKRQNTNQDIVAFTKTLRRLSLDLDVAADGSKRKK